MKCKFVTTYLDETQSSNTVTKQNSDQIPVDLVMEIFSHLPRKPIARFRCVSKSSASILARQDFTELFLTKSSTRPRLLFSIEYKGKIILYSLPLPHQNIGSLVATRYLEYDPPPHWARPGMPIPVCGLVLLERYNRPVQEICNPATGELITLPSVLLKNYHDFIDNFHFGYDPIGKQFKVLCMTSSLCKRPNTHMVLTLESGRRHSWRAIDHKFHFVQRGKTNGREVCINGVLYFGGDLDEDELTMIVSFDVRSEKFAFISTVEEMNGYIDLTLFNYKSKLGVQADERRCAAYREAAFWVLEDGNKWSKHVHAFSESDKEMLRMSYFFVGMTGTCDMVWASPFPLRLFHEPNSFCIFSYSLERKSLRRVDIQGVEEFKKDPYHTPRFCTFVDFVENIKSMQ